MGRKKSEREEKEEEKSSGMKVGCRVKIQAWRRGFRRRAWPPIITAPSSTPRSTALSSAPATLAPSWLPCQRPRRQRGSDLGTRIYGAETCKFGATNDDAELRVQILKLYLQGRSCEKIQKKRKNKKNRPRATSMRRERPGQPHPQREQRATKGEANGIHKTNPTCANG